ncbi:MAG: hypothetical protein IT445_08610 [Phycisphaeraceae bacterium]|nr:hypothetical protein [Phycisphaeraceae bacterium]
MRSCKSWRWWLVFALLAASWTFSAAAAESSRAAYETDLAAFFQLIDNEYPFFELKHVGDDWQHAKSQLMQRARQCETDEQFLAIVLDAIRVLRDGHMGITQSKATLPPPPKSYYPGVSFLPATENRVIVMYAPRSLSAVLKTGTIVTRIDGEHARGYLDQRSEAAWQAGGFFSSPQRAKLFEYRLALCGQQGGKHTISYQGADGERTLDLECNLEASGWPHTYNTPSDLKQVGRSFFFTKLADDVGYMYLRRVDESVTQGIEQALREQPNAKGWIVDLRGNGGGGYDDKLIEQIKKMSRPVAVLIDAGCVSAGETLARDFQSQANARLFGSTTAGSSSSKRSWTFPSGIATLTLSVRSRWRNDRQPIEFNGIDPDVVVEASPEQVQAGADSVILRAQEYLGG